LDEESDEAFGERLAALAIAGVPLALVIVDATYVLAEGAADVGVVIDVEGEEAWSTGAEEVVPVCVLGRRLENCGNGCSGTTIFSRYIVPLRRVFSTHL
jgi:hypothetical protein